MTLEHHPWGVVERADGRRVVVLRDGADAVELTASDPSLYGQGSLDALLAAGPDAWTPAHADAVAELGTLPRHRLDSVRPAPAFAVADYVDFYASEHHATNAGRIFRPDGDALPPAWRHLPLGYHGRSGSVQPSDRDVVRPHGLLGPGHFAPTDRLDLEAEVAFVVGAAGTCVEVEDAARHVFGVTLLNDWSARDVQGFETVPLGPMLGKSFATSLGAWITPLPMLLEAAGLPARTDTQAPAHLHDHGRHALDLHLQVSINDTVLSRPDFSDMYWTFAQLLAHLTSNGSSVRPGDVVASGTVSGPHRAQRGCLLELTWNGAEPLVLADGTERSWLLDGDEVTISATAGALDLGHVRARVSPASRIGHDRAEP